MAGYIRGSPRPYRARMSVHSLTVGELLPTLLLRLHELSSFFLQFGDTPCGNCHGLGRGIVTVHRALQREYELTIDDLVGTEFAGQNRDIVFISAIIIGARR